KGAQDQPLGLEDRLVATPHGRVALELEQLESIAERVAHIEACSPWIPPIEVHRMPDGAAPLGELVQPDDTNRGMSFERRPRVGDDTEVQLVAAECEPRPALAHRGWLRNLEQAEDAAIKGAGGALLIRRHVELHVLERKER